MSLKETMEKAFTDYAGMTIADRAICDARDMLKPAARMSMYAQFIEKITADKPYKKSQKSVAAGMEHFYVHGDLSLYPLLARLGKPFAMRYILEDFQGNTGTIEEPNNEAASRYTEMRLGKLAGHLFDDIEKDTIVKWFDSYTGEEQYPSVLPSKGFYNIVNGTSGIATGIASSIPQFNLREVNGALIKLLNNPDIKDDEILCMPDFAGGGILLNAAEVRESLLKGTGFACKLRSKIEYDKKTNRLIITETPYGVYTSTILGQLREIAQDEEHNPGIERPLDFSGVKANIEVELNKRANIDKVIRYLYKNTSIQYHYPINMTMLDHGKVPKVFTWREALQAHLNHEKEVYTRGFQYDLIKIKARLHIVDGLVIAINNLDEVIRTIKASTDTKSANLALQKLLSIDADQAKAILDMKLSKLAHLEMDKLLKEKADLEKERDRIIPILADEKLLNKEIENGLRAVAAKYGDERRTTIMNVEKDSEEPIEVKQLQISATNKGNVYAFETSSLYTQKRGSVGNKFKMGEGEFIINTITVNSNDKVLFFTSRGQVAHCAASEIPMNEPTSIFALAKFDDNAELSAMAGLTKAGPKNIIFITKRGLIKKSELAEYNLTRNVPVMAIKLDEGDTIVSILLAGTEKIGLLSQNGHFIITPSETINAIGRVARGVIGIKLDEGDEVISAKIMPADCREIVSISGNGLIKRTSINEYAESGRGTKGQLIQKFNSEDWAADFLPLSNPSSILVTATHSNLKIDYADIPLHGRATLGVKAVNLAATSNVVAISKV